MLDQEPEEIVFEPELYDKSLKELQKLMKEAAQNLEYEKAAKYRDRIAELNKQSIGHA
jgi:excinuclease UvrABC helicase subunit UvrB